MKRRSTRSSVQNDVEKLNDVPEQKMSVPHFRTITIKLEAYENIETMLPICNIQTQCFYNLQNLGETEPIPVTDSDVFQMDHTFIFKIDNDSSKDLNMLISYPAILKVYLIPGSFDIDLTQQLSLGQKISISKPRSFDSIISMYEALNDDKITEVSEDSKIKPRKSLKKEKVKPERAKKDKSSEGKSKKQSVGSISKSTVSDYTTSEKKVISGSNVKKQMLFGQSSIDFLPFFYGEKDFKETLLIEQYTDYKDDRMSSFKKHPKIVISVSIDQPLFVKHSMIMNFSVESIFNFPMNPDSDMEVQICWVLPHSDDSFDEPIIMNNPIYTTEKVKNAFKTWPKRTDEESYSSKYRIDSQTNNIKWKLENNISTFFNDECVRLEFNVIKRNFFLQEGRKCIEEIITQYKNIILEIYTYPSSKKRNRYMHEKTGTDKSTFDTPTHLMAIVDVSGLLYPGAQKTRVAAPIRTFCLDEAEKISGLEESYFQSNVHKDSRNENISKSNMLKRDIQDKDKKSGTKSIRSVRKSLKAESINLESVTKKNSPQENEKSERESSTQIYDELGKPCFIVIEIELSHPLIELRDIENLSNNLQELVKKKPDSKTKIVLTATLAKDYYTEVLNEIIRDMNNKFLRFLQDNPKYKTKPNTTQTEFVRFLQNIGAYKLYLHSITRAISLFATTETKFKNIDDNKLGHGFVGEIFCFLIRKMHETVNSLICNGLEPVTKHTDNSKELFFYAKEAAELGLPEIADKYFLERLSNDENNPDYWFDYAIFLLEEKDRDRALECVRLALTKNPNHRYSLLLFGIILDTKQQKEEAETTFQYLMVKEPKWTEGWGVLYLFYQKMDNYVSMEWALDMAKKNLRKYTSSDYFAEFQDLAWSSKRYPNTIFFQTAILLIKMRVFDWAEMACAQETHLNATYISELLSIICYYKKLYSHALKHLEDSRSSKYLDHSIIALSGHCLLGIKKKEEAKNEYYLILQSEHCPDELHLVFMNCSKILEHFGDTQEARKTYLLACKYSPTPYTWFKAGYLYYIQQDFLSSEECLTIANSLYTRSGDVWGYLTLINLKLMRFNEAELCYQQAIKNNLTDDTLFNEITEERKKLNLSD